MTAGSEQAAAEARLRALIDDWARAVRAKDVAGVIAHFAPDIVVFDLAPPLHYAGVDRVERSLEAWFSTFQGPVGLEIRDLTVTTAGDVAFCRSFNHISGTRSDGERTDVWVRSTLGLRKIDGAWKVVHEHASVPFYMDGSYRAAVDLAP